MSNSKKNTNYLAVDFGAISGRMVLGSFGNYRMIMRVRSRFKNLIILVNNHLFRNLPFLYYEMTKAKWKFCIFKDRRNRLKKTA